MNGMYIPYPISKQDGLKTIPFGAAHAYKTYIMESPPPPGDRQTDSGQMSVSGTADGQNTAQFSGFLSLDALCPPLTVKNLPFRPVRYILCHLTAAATTSLVISVYESNLQVCKAIDI